MTPDRFLECLRADMERVRAVAGAAPDLAAQVPTCPDWTLADLLAHLGAVYQHKIQCIRNGVKPDPWPPPELEAEAAESPLALFERSGVELLAVLAGHQPSDPAYTWYDPDQTVGFWMRRMAQETVVHRVDAELTAGELTVVPPDLALDGIDEVLDLFLALEVSWHLSEEGPGSYPGLDKADGRAVTVAAGGRTWMIRPHPAGIDITRDDVAAVTAAAAVRGEPGAVLLWLWRRLGDDAIVVDGDPEPVAYLRELLGPATE